MLPLPSTGPFGAQILALENKNECSQDLRFGYGFVHGGRSFVNIFARSTVNRSAAYSESGWHRPGTAAPAEGADPCGGRYRSCTTTPEAQLCGRWHRSCAASASDGAELCGGRNWPCAATSTPVDKRTSTGSLDCKKLAGGGSRDLPPSFFLS